MRDAVAPSLAAWQPVLIAIASAASVNDNDGAHDLHHLHRVWTNAEALMAAGSGADADADPLIVMAACYLHDLVNLPKNHPERATASRLSAARAVAALAAAGFPAARLQAVAHAIEAHSFSAALPARTLEARLVQDADRLDGLGAIGLARLFYIAGQMGSALAHALDDRAYALDHIVVKLARLPALMQTAAGRALAGQRLARLLAFRDEFALEWGRAP
ncbi:HD domain-containing protein [Massilia sp. PWRC2]|uniref:HD domain-containing protein n=1 Tax=Massilia sp. PWRC2 TaxID=2804626 RepID=UPI003CE6C338